MYKDLATAGSLGPNPRLFPVSVALIGAQACYNARFTLLTELVVVRRLLFVVWFLAAGAWAQQPADPYRVETNVANQSEAERESAAKATLGEVLVRVTGDSSVLLHPAVRDAINDAPDYLAKFSYNSDTSLVLIYSPQAIKSLLQKAQVLASNVGQLDIKVVGVKDFTAFKQVQSYLKAVAVVRKADLVSVTNDTMSFNLTVDGDAALFKSTVALTNKLVPLDESASPLSFRWQE